MSYFVAPGSIVRNIWGQSDVILFIFAGAAAEFSLNKSVDWLYFTGRLPADPIGRLFSTVAYARQIIFAGRTEALAAIDRMRTIHTGVEASRGARIPDEAYRDVLYMLIFYSVAAYELLERRLSREEKNEVFQVFREVGTRMGIAGLPGTYYDWTRDRLNHLEQHLRASTYTTDLYRQYRRHLGSLRYYILLKVQHRLLPPLAAHMLPLSDGPLINALLHLYCRARHTPLRRWAQTLLIPARHRAQARELDQPGDGEAHKKTAGKGK